VHVDDFHRHPTHQTVKQVIRVGIEEAETTSVLLHERRVFRPSAAVVEAARVKDWEAELRA
jgi:hypothetical protein